MADLFDRWFASVFLLSNPVVLLRSWDLMTAAYLAAILASLSSNVARLDLVNRANCI